MKTSAYQLLKLHVLQAVPLAKDAVHIYIGFGCLLFALLVLRRPLRSWWALLPGLLVAVGMEIFDLRDDYASLGHFRWGASFKDIVNANVIPLLLVLLAKWRQIKT